MTTLQTPTLDEARTRANELQARHNDIVARLRALEAVKLGPGGAAAVRARHEIDRLVVERDLAGADAADARAVLKPLVEADRRQRYADAQKVLNVHRKKLAAALFRARDLSTAMLQEIGQLDPDGTLGLANNAGTWSELHVSTPWHDTRLDAWLRSMRAEYGADV